MAQTFATSEYKEKLFGNLTLHQSALMLAACAPGVMLASNGYSAGYVIPYGLLCLALYAGLAYHDIDERVLALIGYARSGRRILWGTRQMEEFLGVEDIDRDAVKTRDGRLLSVLKVMPKDLGGLSETDMERAISGYGVFLHELSANIQVIMSSREIDVESYLMRLRERVLLGGRPQSIAYYEHYAAFMREVVESKTVTDRDYHIVISQNVGGSSEGALRDLDAKTRNLAASLRDAGIECERLGTDALVGFYAGFYNPRFRLADDPWSPVTFHAPLAGFRPGPAVADGTAGFADGGIERVRNPSDRRSQILGELMPSSVDVHRDRADIEKLHRVLYAMRFPSSVHPGWLTKLIRQPIDFDVVFHIHPLSQKTSVEYLQKELAKLETDVTVREREGLIVAEKDRVCLEKVRELLGRVSRDEEKCFDVALYVNVKAYTEKELDVAVMRVRDVIEGMGAQLRVARWEMAEALRSCYPIAYDGLGEKRDRMFPSSAVRDSYPFILSSLEDRGDRAVVAGYNQFNGVPVLIDLYRQPNPHVLVLGSSGSGKSFLVKKLMLCQAMQDTDIYVVDPQGEYGPAVRAMGGKVVKLSPDSDSVINLFEIGPDTYDGRKGAVKAFFNLVRGGLDERQSGAVAGIVDKMLDNAYRKVGIYADEPGTWTRRPPTFSDVYEALNAFASESGSKAESWKKTTAEALLSCITPLVFGDMRYLNSQTTVDLAGGGIVSFDLSSASAYKPHQRAMALFIVFDHVYSRMLSAGGRRRMIIVDEAWCVFENNQDWLGPIVRTGRKNNVGVVMIDQNVEDLLARDQAGRPRGHVILNNTSTKFILRQEASALRLVSETFALTESQSEFLKSAGSGDALMLTPTAKLPLLVLASGYELALLSTSPEGEAKPHVEAERPRAGAPLVRASGLAAGSFRRLLSDGYIEAVGSGGRLGGSALYLVRPCQTGEALHNLARELIAERLRAMAEGGEVRTHARILPDITYAGVGGESAAIEVFSAADILSPDAETARKHANMLEYSASRLVVWAAVDGEALRVARGRGYANVVPYEAAADHAIGVLSNGGRSP